MYKYKKVDFNLFAAFCRTLVYSYSLHIKRTIKTHPFASIMRTTKVITRQLNKYNSVKTHVNIMPSSIFLCFVVVFVVFTVYFFYYYYFLFSFYFRAQRDRGET